MGRRGAPLRSLPPARPGPSPRARGVQSSAASPPRSPPRAPRGAEQSGAPGAAGPRRVGPPAALTLASGGRISTWLFSSSFFAASFCANAELNDTFTMVCPQHSARRRTRTRSSPHRRSFAGCPLPCHPPLLPRRGCRPRPLVRRLRRRRRRRCLTGRAERGGGGSRASPSAQCLPRRGGRGAPSGRGFPLWARWPRGRGPVCAWPCPGRCGPVLRAETLEGPCPPGRGSVPAHGGAPGWDTAGAALPWGTAGTSGSARPVQCQHFPDCHFNLGCFAKRKCLGLMFVKKIPKILYRQRGGEIHPFLNP